MRALQLIDHLGSGGAQTIVLDLARLLPRHGIEVEVAHLFAPNVLSDAFSEAGCTVHDLSTGGRYSPLAALDPRPMLRLRRLLRERSFDIVNLHLYIAPLHYRLARGAAATTPRVANTVHAHEEHLPSYVYPSYRATRRVTDTFIADFHASRVRLEQVAGQHSDVAVIPFGTSPIDAAPASARKELRAEWNIQSDELVVMSVARLHEQRCLDRIIDSFARVGHERAVLVLVGDGPDEAALRDRAAQLGISERVRFVGRRSDLERCFSAADIFVSMSVGGDVGIAALQASSAGLPVLAWDILGTTIGVDQLDDGHVALTGADAAFDGLLGSVLHDDALRERVITHGRRVSRSTFSVEGMASSYAQLYERVVSVDSAIS